MQDRSSKEILQDIHSTHKKLARLHEELEAQLNISQKTNRTTTTQRHVHIDGTGYLLNVGDTVEILTTGLTANKGEQTTVTRLLKYKVEVRTNNRKRITQRKPLNLRWTGTGQDEHTS